jgi:transposase
MRGRASNQSSMICLVSPERQVPAEHPLREIKRLVENALRRLSPMFDAMYAATGRPSVPPEQLLKGSLLMALYTVRSERQFCEQLQYNLLFRWFLDMDMLEDAFDPSAFSHNRERLMEHDVAGEFFAAIRDEARDLMSRDHFSVDGTLIEAWASRKSFRPIGDKSGDNNGWADFRGQKCRNQTHRSRTDSQARLVRKGHSQEAKLCFAGHALIENRHGLLVELQVSQATGHAERDVALEMLYPHRRQHGRQTVGADRGYDTRDFVASCRAQGVTPHVAKNEHRRRRSAIDHRTSRHPGYAVSQRKRMRIEQVFGWTKVFGGLRKVRVRGVERIQAAAHLVGAAYNLVRIVNLRRPQ